MKKLFLFKTTVFFIVLFTGMEAPVIWGIDYPSTGEFPYEILIEPAEIPGLPGIHSYAFGQSGNKWLLIGGRLDGLHTRQPNRSFPPAENNDTLYVTDPDTGDVWSCPLDSFPSRLAEQLRSTNMCFYQDGNLLYLAGGYGFSNSAGDHITFPYLTAVEVSEAAEAVAKGRSPLPYFHQTENDRFAVTGGQLGKIGDHFYLAGGHRFDGRYNPMGRPTYTQTYTNQIRIFTADQGDDGITFKLMDPITDTEHLHRRDYNLVPQIYEDGSYGYMISGGVFQYNADLPYLYPVEIRGETINPRTGFNQYLSHYHSAKAAIYDEQNRRTHAVFFGGMSRYYLEKGQLKQDDLVPFVGTVSMISRDESGNLKEFVLPFKMPGLEGASAEFIPNRSLLKNGEKIIRLQAGSGRGKPLLIGYIYGGILSPERNPFSRNRTDITSASGVLYRVYIKRR